MTAPPGDRRRVFVVEQSGRIMLLLGGKRVSRPFLDLSGEVTAGGEQGLLSMAFAPDYAASGRFYVYFTDRGGDQRVQEFRRSSGSPNRADVSTRRQVMSMADPYPNHNGGLLLFGPDGLLYIGTGDGGSGGDPENRAQNLESLLGKILRIDPRADGSSAYRVPSSNPFVGRAGRDEIYAYGLRNPWRFSFDRRNGNLYIGDVGQDQFEEIDFARRGGARGRNYGWSCFEGRRRFDDSRNCAGATPPILQYGRSGGECSVTGGVVVRDPGLPALAGRYVYGDYCVGRMRSFRVRGGRATGDRRPAAARATSSARSARMPAAGCTRRRSPARSTGSARGSSTIRPARETGGARSSPARTAARCSPPRAACRCRPAAARRRG